MLRRLWKAWAARSDPKALARSSSARYVTQHMGDAAEYPGRPELLEYALRQCSVPGLVLEFGVFRGDSLKFIAKRVQGEAHGFDSFEGLPEDWTEWQKAGRFSLEGRVPDIGEPNVVLHKGLFEDTLPPFIASHPGPVRFIHLDSDIYSSARTVLAHVGDRLARGSILVFDEYMGYPGWQDHEHRAWREFVQEKGVSYEYIGYAAAGQAAVRITTAPG